jgi:hypothetical protein
MDKLKGADIDALLLDRRLFGVASRYSPKYGEVEAQVTELTKKSKAEGLTDKEQTALEENLDQLQMLMTKNESLVGKGVYMSQMADLRKSLIKDLAAELRKARG